MIAAVLTGPKSFELRKVERPGINENEVIIKLEGCGVCSSSIPLWEGREWFSYPQEAGSPGHEGWGTVDEIGKAVKNINRGDRVAFLSYHGYGEYDKASAEEVIKLPEALNSQPFPGEPLGCAINIFERSSISQGDTVSIIGSGFLGALLCQLCKSAGAKVFAVSKRKYSLEVAKKFGADEIVELTNTWESENKIREITNGLYCTKVIEATGKQEGLDVATEIIAEGGKLIIAGYHQDGLRQVNVQKWNWKGIDVINAHERNPAKYVAGIKKAVDCVLSGRMDPSPLYTHILNLDEIGKGFELTVSRPDGFMKALIQI